MSHELILAVEDGNLNEVQRLLAQGADVNHTDGYGMAPLNFAAMNGHVEVVQLLVSFDADVSKINSYSKNEKIQQAILDGQKEYKQRQRFVSADFFGFVALARHCGDEDFALENGPALPQDILLYILRMMTGYSKFETYDEERQKLFPTQQFFKAFKQAELRRSNENHHAIANQASTSSAGQAIENQASTSGVSNTI